MSFEVSKFGIESVIVVPGAFTKGTEHFAHAQGAGDVAVTAQYGELAGAMGPRLEAIDAENGGSLDVKAVGRRCAVYSRYRMASAHRVLSWTRSKKASKR